MKLAGLTVLDFTQFMAGPMASAILADHGAKVIKIEPPTGDPTRRGPRSDPRQHSGDTFHALNRGKLSLVLDLKRPAHVKVARRLIEQADVLIESFRPGVAERLGIGYRAASAIKPDLVYCSLSAFGQTGLLKDLPAHDTTVQALAGAFAFDAEGRPVEPPISMAAVSAAQYAVSAILMALLAVRSGQGGDHIDIAMFDALLSIRGGLAARALASLDRPDEFEGAPNYALSACYRTADGLWLRVDARDAHASRALLEALDLRKWGPHALAAGCECQGELSRMLIAVFARECREHWLARLASTGAVAPIVGYLEALAGAHATSRRQVQVDAAGTRQLASPMRFLNDSIGIPFPAPALGQDGQAVLAQAGYEEAETEALGFSGNGIAEP